jgi:hypothetical protein
MRPRRRRSTAAPHRLICGRPRSLSNIWWSHRTTDLAAGSAAPVGLRDASRPHPHAPPPLTRMTGHATGRAFPVSTHFTKRLLTARCDRCRERICARRC